METFLSINSEIALTPFQPEDKTALVRYLNDPELYRNTLKVPNPYTEADAVEWLEFVRDTREKFGVETQWAIRNRTGDLIGGIGRFVHNGLEGHADEIGYWLAAPYRGQGIMSDVVDRLCDWLLEHTPLVRIEAKVFPHNPASARVLEKAGFEREGYARKLQQKNGVFLDAILLARIKK